MPIRSLPCILLLVAFLAVPSRADDPVALAVKRSKSTRWKVEQTLDLASKSKGVTTFAGGAGTAQMLVKGHVTVKEKWTDVGTKEEDGRLIELKRTVSSSKIRAQKGAGQATALHRATLVFEIGEGGHDVRATKGAPPDLCIDLLEAGPLDPVEILLPADPVRVGDVWEVGTLDVMRFQQQICVGVAAAKGSARNALTGLLESLADQSPASAAKIVKGTLLSVRGNVATIEFQDDKTHDAITDQPHEGPLFDMPASTTKIEGTLTFDVKRGMPVKLTWTQVHDVDDFTPGHDIPGGNITMPGFTETWKVSKTWK